MAKPLVTHVIWDLGRAGAERLVLDLSRALPASGYTCSVIAAGGGGEMQGDFLQAGIPLAIGPQTHDRLETIAFLRKQLRLSRPEILHTHLGGDIWAGWVARRERIHPWIITAHNDDRDVPWGTYLARRWAFHRADHIVCVSETVKEYLRREYNVRDARMSVIRNGIDLSAFSWRGHRPRRDVPRLLTVGRLMPQKNHVVLLKALAQIQRPWHLDIVGDGPERASLKALATELGILPRVQFVGVVSNVADYYREADLFLFPSAWEGQGLALVEAMATGVPAIASDLPVFRETFDEQVLSFAPPLDVRSWTKAIERALQNESSMGEQAERARPIIERQFSLDRMTKKYAELYREQLKKFRV